jgi:hypothetical protein
MPPAATGRPPTVEDLTPEQRRIYDHIQGEDVRQLYLNSLPPIRESPASRRQAEQLRRRLEVLAALRDYSEAESERLREFLAQAERGRTTNLNRELVPPTLPGVVLRFRREHPGRRVAPGPGAEPAAPALARPSRVARQRSTPAAAPPRRRQPGAAAGGPQAPIGRVQEGTPLCPWGYKKDGPPARPRGSAARAEEQIDNSIARRATNPALRAEEVEPHGRR